MLLYTAFKMTKITVCATIRLYNYSYFSRIHHCFTVQKASEIFYTVKYRIKLDPIIQSIEVAVFILKDINQDYVFPFNCITIECNLIIKRPWGFRMLNFVEDFISSCENINLNVFY